MQIPLIRLQCGVNSYDWGKVGKESVAAKYGSATPSDDFLIQEDKPYAEKVRAEQNELWMGTHPSLPSKDLETKRTLLDLVQDNQALMSTEINEKYGHKLPFLFKVLSIQKALSIQAHPNKKLAEELHKKDPKNYPDDNHKPEMTIAITPFEGICGFRPLAEISHFLSSVPSLRNLLGNEAATTFEQTVRGYETSEKPDDIDRNKKALQAAFSALMTSSEDSVTSAAEKLVESAKEEAEDFAGGGGSSNDGQELAELVTRLNSQFEHDIGLFVLFFLNYVKLQPGEAMFLKADDIHAYLSGDIIECMASSDNVIRAGFTPKYQDIATLTSTLTYSYSPPSSQKLHTTSYPYCTLNNSAYSSSSTCTLYDPPIEEFSVVKIDLKKKGAKVTFEGIKGPSILICTSGQGSIAVGPKSMEVKEGWVFFVGATAECAVESDGEGFVLFKAFCELHGKEGANGAD